MIVGDILGGVFGGGKNTSEEQTADPTSQAMNEMRLSQLRQLFAKSGIAGYAKSRPDIYSLSGQTQGLIDDTM